MRPNAALASLLFASACSTPSVPPPVDTTAPRERPADPPAKPARSAAASEKLAAAQAELTAGKPLDALLLLDEALKLAPQDAEVWLTRGAAMFAAGGVQRDGSFYTDALLAYEKALALGADSRALFGASRAARGTLDPDKAVQYARQALLADSEPSPAELQIAVESTFALYIQRRQAQVESQALFDETEGLIVRLQRHDPNDAWCLEQLANLYEWEGRKTGAVEILGRLIQVRPDVQSYHERFLPLKKELEGPEAVASYYESLFAQHPGSGFAAWYAGAETFDLAVAAMGTLSEAVARFERAEQRFAACRKAVAEYEQACLGYEVMCRAGVGWAKFTADDLDGAERAFLSMEELFPGGMEWQIQGRLQSGVIGLTYVADKALRGSGDDRGGFALGAAARAAGIYARLRRYRPSDANFANNCGFFHREWGVGSVFKSREYAELARQATDTAVAELNQALAHSTAHEARNVLRECRDAYLEAARLAPTDVRIVNDAALILVYHFPAQLELAEKLLQQAIDAGDARKKDTSLDAEALDLLTEAWGDAYQNFGVSYLIHRKDPARAKQYFMLCHSIGPRPRVGREWAKEVALPLCDAAAGGAPIDLLELDPRIFFVE